MAPFRVLHTVRHRWLARTETWLFNQVRFLPPHVECHVVARVSENGTQYPTNNLHAQEDAPLLRRSVDEAMERMRFVRYPGFLVERGRTIKPDLIHAHFGGWGWSVLGAARRIGAPLVVTFYGFDVNQLPQAVPRFRRRYRELFRRAAGILCEGEHMRSCIVKLGCPPEKAHVHRLGIDLGAIEFRPRGIDPGRPLRVLVAAAFREKKGIPLAMEAIGRLARTHDVQVTLVGDASELEASQREKDRINAAIADAGLASRVHRRGFLPHDEMLGLAADHDLFLAPSLEAADGDTEGGAPVALIEMAAAGLPIVASDHCDIPGIVREGETGVLAREGDLDDLVGALGRALRIGQGWQQITRNARAHVEQQFDAARQGRALAARYRQIIDEARARRS